MGKILKQIKNWCLKVFIAGKKVLKHAERFHAHRYPTIRNINKNLINSKLRSPTEHMESRAKINMI